MYEFKEFTSEYRSGVLDILTYLWKYPRHIIEKLFRWKHETNPLLSQPIGIVALCDGQVVGFRGLFAEQFQIVDSTIKVLSPCDTCVHPDHRRKGLLTKMSAVAMDLYKDEFRFFLNLSSNNASGSGNMKMGYQVLSHKSYFRRLNPFKLLPKWLIWPRRVCDNLRIYTEPDVFAPLVTSVYERQPAMSRCDMVRSEDYVHWRYSNPRAKYRFLFLMEGDAPTCYFALRVFDHAAWVMDYAGISEMEGLPSLLSIVTKSQPFVILSILDLPMPQSLKKSLRTQHFHAYERLEQIIRRRSPYFPILLRPVRADFREQDWFVDNRDMRLIENWNLTSISSDGS
jgi:GNAT superfamily N-acetyltransferase